MGLRMMRAGLALPLLALGALSCALSPERRVDRLFETRREGTEAVLEKAPAALDDPSASVRATATWMLGETGHPSVVPLLLRALSDPDPGVKGAALGALPRFCAGDPADGTASASSPEGLGEAGEETEAPATPAEPPVAEGGGDGVRIAREAIGLAQHPEAAVRYRAVVALARCDPAGGVEAFRRAAGDPDPDVRGEALRALSEAPVPPAESLPELTRVLLADAEWKNRFSAVSVLGRGGDGQTLSLLAIARTDANPLVRAEAVQAFRSAERWAAGHETPPDTGRPGSAGGPARSRPPEPGPGAGIAPAEEAAGEPPAGEEGEPQGLDQGGGDP